MLTHYDATPAPVESSRVSSQAESYCKEQTELEIINFTSDLRPSFKPAALVQNKPGSVLDELLLKQM